MAFEAIEENEFLDALFDRQVLMETGLAFAGGAVGGVGFTQLLTLKFFEDEPGKETTGLLKRAAAGFAAAAVGGLALARLSDPAAKGFVGGVGAKVGEMVWAFAKQKMEASKAGAETAGLYGYGLSDSASSRIELGSTRSYSGESLPANVGGLSRVSVSTPDPAELATLMSFAS